jgi:outer membrane receptor protein involved in Fe transport
MYWINFAKTINEWDLVPKTSSNGEPVPFDGVLSPDLFTFNGTSSAQGSPRNPLTYSATEKIYAAYIQANITFSEKLSVLAGVRYEHTEQGWKTAQDPTVTYGAIGTIPYGDFLPSVHFKYKLTPNKTCDCLTSALLTGPDFLNIYRLLLMMTTLPLVATQILNMLLLRTLISGTKYFRVG